MRKVSALDSRNRILFESKAAGPETFAVIGFRGEEGLSRCYRFEIDLVSESADVDLDELLAQAAVLEVVQGEHRTKYHGVLAEFEERHQKEGDTYYRAVLVPRLWQLSLYRVNEVYVDRTTQQVIAEVLEEAGFTSLDYELALSGTYTPWTHLCEYQETHLDFVSRLMERDGLYYYFEQGEDRAKLVVTDARSRHAPVSGIGPVNYEPISGLQPDPDKPTLHALVCRQKPLPHKLILMDYNYRKPTLELKSEVTVDEAGRGEVYLYGEHADDGAESRQLAEVRAQELRCRKRTFHGESSVSALCAGFLAEVSGHFRREFNQNYLVIEITHEGSQAGMVLRGSGAVGAEGTPFYRNTFTAIASDVQFRPERVTPKPRIHGTMNALIDAEGSGSDPELDEFGRYKVRVSFDRAEHGDAKASQWVRMATPYAGSDHGMHFPLRKGTEVLLTFIDGDPNRPIIAGAVPNADTPSVANSDNERSVVSRFRGGHDIVISGSGRTQMAGVGAQAVSAAAGAVKYPENTSNDGVTPESFGTNQWEIDNGWENDAVTFDLDTGPGAKTLTTVNNVLHTYSTSCERYLGPVVTTIVGDNNLTVRGSVYTYVGDPAASIKKNAEYDLPAYDSDINAEQGGIDGANVASASFAKWFQAMGDSMSPTRSAANGPGSSVTYIEGTSRTTVRGTNISVILGDQDSTVQSDSFNKYLGRTNNFFGGNTFLFYLGAQETVSISNNFAMNVGFAETVNIAGVLTLSGPLTTTINYGANITIDVSKSGVSVNKMDADVSKLQAQASKLESSVSTVAGVVSNVKATTNDVKAKVNEVAAVTNKLDAGMNSLATYNNKLSSALANVETNAITLIA